MQRPPEASIPDYRPWALAVANVGTWRSSLAEQLGFCDSVTAEMFGFTEEEGVHGIPFSRIRGIIHPDDRAVFDERTRQYRDVGGYIVIEYRIIPRPGELRWIFLRGRYDRPPNSIGVIGHGIAIDITASKADGKGEAGQLYTVKTPVRGGSSSLQRAADAAIALHRESQRLGEDVPGLQVLADLALHTIGRELAGRTIPDDLS